MNLHHLIKTYLLVFVAIALFSGCSDSDGEPAVENTITIDGVPFKGAVVTLVGVSIDGEGHAGISFTVSNGSASKVLTVDFEYSPSSSLTGIYSFPEANNHRLLDDWLTSYTEFNGNSEMTSTNLNSGTLTLEDLGSSKYKVTIQLMMIDGTIFKGTYKGPIVAVFNNG